VSLLLRSRQVVAFDLSIPAQIVGHHDERGRYALTVCGRHAGPVPTSTIARRMVVAPHRAGGQAQFVERALPPARRDGLEATREWMLERLEEPLTVAAMARHAHRVPASVQRRCAVTSISNFMRGSVSPHSCIVAAGRTSPNARRSAGQQASKSDASGSR
jgi:hypothetical protein